MSPKERRDAITQNGLSSLRIVDERTINCKRDAPFLIVDSLTARRLSNTGSMQHARSQYRNVQLFVHTSVVPIQQHASRHSSKLNSSPRLRNA